MWRGKTPDVYCTEHPLPSILINSLTLKTLNSSFIMIHEMHKKADEKKGEARIKV